MKALGFSNHVLLPPDAATETFGLLGKKGSGKTYAAQLLFELLHRDAGVQCLALDPVGNWPFLRLAKDGRSVGLPVPVFGGSKGDIPLEPTAGAFIARVIVERGISAILDVSRFRKGERKRFMTDFAEEFFHLKKDNVSPVHLFVEEAHVFCPQRPQKGEERMLGAMEDLVRIGRNYGIGCSLISQRAASVNKDVLTQVECLLAFQTSSAQDKKAIREWVSENDEEGVALLQGLKGLGKGDALFWSPSWLRRFLVIHTSEKSTFDGSATPKVGAKPVKPRQLAPIELEQIREAMKETIVAAEANDVDKLKATVARTKARVAELEADLQRVRALPAPVSVGKVKAKIERVEVSVVKPAEITRLEKMLATGEVLLKRFDASGERLAQLGKAGENLSQFGASLKGAMTELSRSIDVAHRPPQEPRQLDVVPPAVPLQSQHLLVGKKRRDLSESHERREIEEPSGGLSRPQQTMIDVLSSLLSIGIEAAPRGMLAVLSDQSPRSSGFSNNLSALKTRGALGYPATSMVAITIAGHRLAHRLITPITLESYHQAWISKVSRPQARMISEVVAAWPLAISRAVLAERSDQSPTSSGFSNNLSAMHSIELFSYPGTGMVRATDLLFPSGLLERRTAVG